MKRFYVTALLIFISCTAMATDAKISSHAVRPYTPTGYPKLFSKFGEKKIKEVNALMPQAAKKAADSPECDQVDLVALSEQRSSPTGDIVFFVDCLNGKRFYISKEDLMSTSASQSQSVKMHSVSDRQASDACDMAIKAQLANPMTFDKKFASNSVYRAPSTGNIVVEFSFTAKNNMGGELPHKARCVFDDRGLQDAIISK